MGLGSTAKKLQKVASLAEESYKRMNELREQLLALRDEVQHTSEQVDHLETDVAEQRALIEALAEQQGIDVDAVIEEVQAEAEADEDNSEEGQEVPVSDAEEQPSQ